ncbi:MAG: Holliday junction branch migration protein RuvA [Microbacteriaceae bacterium]
MISSVRGTVLSVAGTTAVIQVGGIGLAVAVTTQHGLTLRVGSEATVHTALIVREDDLSLFGFATRDELIVFDLLRGVTGVGPKSALGVLSAMSPDEVATAVAREDDGAFRKVSGIGPKTAKLITLSLSGKIAVTHAPSGARTAVTPADVAVVEALVGLGWPERLAATTVDDISGTVSDADRASVPTMLRLALAQLGPAQKAPRS